MESFDRDYMCASSQENPFFSRLKMSAQRYIRARELKLCAHSSSLAMILSIERITKTLISPPLVCAFVVRMQKTLIFSRRLHVFKGFRSHLPNLFIYKNVLLLNISDLLRM